MARCTSSSAGGSISVLNLPALALYRTAPDNPRRHVSTRRRLLPRARPGAGDGGRRRRAARAPVAQARRAARVPRTQPAAAAHPRAPRRIALERPRREAGAPLVERGTARLPARPGRRRGAGGRRPDRPRRGRRDARLRPLRGVVRARRLARRGRTRPGRLSRRALDSRRQSVRRLARWRAGPVARAERRRADTIRRRVAGAGRPGGGGNGRVAGTRRRSRVRAGGPGGDARPGARGRPGGRAARGRRRRGRAGRSGRDRARPRDRATDRSDPRGARGPPGARGAAGRAAAPAAVRTGLRARGAGGGLLAAGLADAPGIAGAPPDALAALGSLAPDLAVRFRRVDAALPVGEAVRDAVVAAAHERPVLLTLDDAQWIDAATLESLPGLARDATRRPVLLLFGLARGAPESGRLDELRARVGRELEGEVIRLGRLDPVALRALVAWALPAYAALDADRLARRLENDTAGLPLLAVAMLEAVASGYKLAPDAPAWPSPQRTLVDSLPNDLPPAVVGVVCLRFRQLPAAAQQLLGAAAALGERVDVGQLATATRLERTAVEPALDLLEWERWLAADARGYVFTAPIVRSILLQEMVTPGQAKRYRENRST